MKRLIVVYNPNSSQYVHVRSDILSELPNFKRLTIAKYAIKKTSFDFNEKTLIAILKSGDLVLAVGGDATASVALNAILNSDKDITLAVLPYGNFNDLARTLKTMHKKPVFEFIRSFTGTEQAPVTPTIKKLYPLDIIVDGTHWRYASSYVTIGMTAEAVELFDEPKFRKGMQKGHKSSWRSYLALAKWYFKNRHKKIFIPEFTLNGHPTKKGISDYCALSGRSMCRVMKGGDDYLDPRVFRSENCRLVSFPQLFVLMTKSILSRTPGTPTTRDLLEFTVPATVEIQAEGEYKTFTDITTIEVVKPNKYIKVVHG